MGTTIFSEPATVVLSGAGSVNEMAQMEGESPADYAIQFANALCNGEPMSAQRARFAALVDIAGRLDSDNAAAIEIGRHLYILDALFRRLVIDGYAAMKSESRGASEAAERLLNAAFKAQRASMGCLSALKVLRDSRKAPTTPTPTSVAESVPLVLNSN